MLEINNSVGESTISHSKLIEKTSDQTDEQSRSEESSIGRKPSEDWSSNASRSRQRRRQSRIRSEAINFAQTVSLIGLTHATNKRSSRARRCVWATWVLVGIALALYQTQDRIVYYLSYPYNTEFHIESPVRLRFPQVTICKENWASRSAAREIGVEKPFLQLIELLKESLVANTSKKEFSERVNATLTELQNLTANWDVLSKRLAHPWRKIVSKVYWQGTQERDLIEDIPTDAGPCFTIGSENRPLFSIDAGQRFGLELHLKALQSDSMPMLTYRKDFFSGFRVLLHDPMEIPRMLEAGFIVSTGTVNQVAISFSNSTNLGPPYYDCDEDPDYRVENCLAECEDSFFFNECGCRPFYLYLPVNESWDKPCCSFYEHFKCLTKFRDTRIANATLCNCAQQCHSRLYGYSLSQSKISKFFIPFLEPERLRTNNSIDESDTTVLLIYFPSLMYMNIQAESTYTVFALLCDVGGALSLLLGATLLTLYEVAEFLFLVSADYALTKLRKKQQSNSLQLKCICAK